MFSVKWFDKVIAQSSRGQFVAFAVALAAMILAGALVGHFVLDRENADNAKFGRPATWGLMQCVDGGFVDATITTNTKTDDKGTITREAPLYVIFLSLGFWLAGAILMSFFTGAAANFLDARREKIRTGDVDYAFEKDYILIVGYDFQVKNLIRKLLRDHPKESVVLVTDSPVDAIYDDILPELSTDEKRLFYAMRKDIAQPDSYGRLLILGADEIYVIGDGDVAGRDGKTLKAVDLLSEQAKVESALLKTKGSPVLAKRNLAKLYLHIEDSVLYTQVRAMSLPIDETGLFDVEIYNYYESWAWECWSRNGAADGNPKNADGLQYKSESYLPIRHKQMAKRVELFVLGAGRMGRAMVNFALPLMNYGADGKRSKITIFDANNLKRGFLSDRDTLKDLPEIEVEFLQLDGCSDEANKIMYEAAENPDAAVTVVIALKNPDAAVRAYAELSNRLRRQNVSVLIWQAAHSENCPDKKYLKMGGPDTKADKTEVRYFGMTDKLPWQSTDRSEWGMAVNYYYELWFKYDEDKNEPYPASPSVCNPKFALESREVWKRDIAVDLWKKTKRWKKWSSINSGDTFREKQVVLSNGDYAGIIPTVMKAEHNRWWTERLLNGWTYDPSLAADIRPRADHQDKVQMLHGDMVPFEELQEPVKDKDKINIAAMAACGFI